MISLPPFYTSKIHIQDHPESNGHHHSNDRQISSTYPLPFPTHKDPQLEQQTLNIFPNLKETLIRADRLSVL